MIDRRGHVVELQSLRGLAAMIVLAGHVLAYPVVVAPWLAAVRSLVNAHASVVLFFVLSGFVLTRSLRGRVNGPAGIAAFYVKRVFRIYPGLWAATLLGIAYIVWLHPLRITANESPWFAHFFLPEATGPRAYLLALGGTAHVLPQGWSIFIEILASAALPFVAWALSRSPLVFGVVLICALAASFGIPSSPYGVAIYFVDFVIGAALTALPGQVRAGLAALSPSAARVAFAVVGIVLIALRAVWITAYDDPRLQLAEAVLAAAMVVLVVHSRLDVAWLRRASVARLGDISYSVYLFHFPLLCIAALVLGRFVTPAGAPALFALALLAITAAATLVVATWSYRWIELPGIAAGKRAADQLKHEVASRRRAA